MRRYIIPLVLAVALIATGVWGYNQSVSARNYYTAMDNQNQRMFYELIGHVENIELFLAKAMVATDVNQNMVVYSNVWNNAYNAQEKLSQLPLDHESIRRTEKFLSQVGDYCYSLMKENVNGEEITEEQYDTLTKLHNNAGMLGEELNKLREMVEGGTITFSKIRRRGQDDLREANKDILNSKINELNERIINYPELIYDGPFSEDVLNIRPRGLTGAQVTVEKAQQIAIDFVGKDKVSSVRDATKGNGVIATYDFELVPSKEGNPPIYVSVSRKGGHVVMLLNPRTITQTNVSQKQAIDNANRFLANQGYDHMVPTYSLRYNNEAVINYAGYKDGVVIYPDLIKVKVSLDNGEIVGYEAASYLVSHTNRTIAKPKLTEEEAMAKVSMNADIKDGRLALIPLESKKEVLCYEFKCDFEGDQFLIYINADTGVEERILKIIVTQKGTLTI